MYRDPSWLAALRRHPSYRAAIWALRLYLLCVPVAVLAVLAVAPGGTFAAMGAVILLAGAADVTGRIQLAKAGADVSWWRRNLGLDRETSAAVWWDVFTRRRWQEWDELHPPADPAGDGWLPIRWEPHHDRDPDG